VFRSGVAFYMFPNTTLFTNVNGVVISLLSERGVGGIRLVDANSGGAMASGVKLDGIFTKTDIYFAASPKKNMLYRGAQAAVRILLVIMIVFDNKRGIRYLMMV
jgi:hypothetical protein